MGLYAGFSLALGAGTLVDDLLGWKWAYLLAATVGLVVAAVTFLTVPEPLPLSGRPRQQPVSRTPTMAGFPYDESTTPWRGGGENGGSTSRLNSSSTYSLVSREEAGGSAGDSAERRPAFREYGSSRHAVNGGRNDGAEEESSGAAEGSNVGRGTAPSSGMAAVSSGGKRKPRPPPPPEGASNGPLSRPFSSRGLATHANPRPHHAVVTGDGARRPRGKLSELSAAWLTSPSLLLVCVAGGVRDAGGFVFGYYLASYFSPLLDGNAALTRHGADPCSFSFNADFAGDQVRARSVGWR